MIHRDLCDPAYTKNWSSLRMQFNILLARHVCWNGLVPLTPAEIADFLRCEVQSVRKHIKHAIREGIVHLEGDRLYLIKRVSDHHQGYVKHFPFLESEAFKAMSVHAQRFVLYCLWAGVHTGRPLKRDLTSLYHSTIERQGVLNLYFKAPIHGILEEVKPFLKIQTFIERKKEWFRVSGLQDTYAREEALPNIGEAKLLQDTLVHRYADELLSAVSREEILKVKRYIINRLGTVGLEVYDLALSKLLAIHKLFELNISGEVGIYFRSIIDDIEQKIVPTIQKRIHQTKTALQRTKDVLTEYAEDWIERLEDRVKLLTHIYKIIMTKKEHPPEYTKSVISFPFYNWLESK